MWFRGANLLVSHAYDWRARGRKTRRMGYGDSILDHPSWCRGRIMERKRRHARGGLARGLFSLAGSCLEGSAARVRLVCTSGLHSPRSGNNFIAIYFEPIKVGTNLFGINLSKSTPVNLFRSIRPLI